ncbi:hypothetical protein ANO14919_073250 [Xylariales sp. No.14919]|nr:hypothetical protein ANO14919_073250 [Xylariales sp. No.14919]
MVLEHFLNSSSPLTATATTKHISPASATSLSASQSNFIANPAHTNPGTSSLGLNAILMLSIGLLGLLLAIPGFFVALRSLSSHRSEFDSSRK